MTATKALVRTTLISAAALLIAAMALCLAHTQPAFAANHNIKWVTQENNAGQVTSAKATWDAVSGATGYYVTVEDANGNTIDASNITAPSFDASNSVLAESRRSGTYTCKVMAYKTGGFENFDSEPLELKYLIVDNQGHGEDVVIPHLKSGTGASYAIKYGYIPTLNAGANPTTYYDGGSALIGVALYEKSKYSSIDALLDQTSYSLADPIHKNYGLTGNYRFYAIWFDVIDTVNLSIKPPACGEQTSTNKNWTGKTYDFSTQTNGPQITLPEGSHYHYLTGDDGHPGYWDATATGDNPYIGTFTGGNSYFFDSYLEADYGYVFAPANELNLVADGATNTTVDQNGSTNTYCQWLLDPTYGATPVWVRGKVPVNHVKKDGGVVTHEATCTNEGTRTFECAACQSAFPEQIAIDPNAHEWGAWKALDESFHQRICQHDGSHTQEAAHVLEGGSITQATLTSDGLIVGQHCSICGHGAADSIVHHPSSFTLSPSKFTYTGNACKPEVTIMDANENVIDASNYTVAYENNMNAGTGKAIITFKNLYSGIKKVPFTIDKAANTIAVKGKTCKLKLKNVKKRAQKIKAGSAFSIANAKGNVTFAKVKANKSNGRFSISKAGKITVKKKTKKGTYKLQVRVMASGDGNFNAHEKVVTVNIKIS